MKQPTSLICLKRTSGRLLEAIIKILREKIAYLLIIRAESELIILLAIQERNDHLRSISDPYESSEASSRGFDSDGVRITVFLPVQVAPIFGLTLSPVLQHFVKRLRGGNVEHLRIPLKWGTDSGEVGQRRSGATLVTAMISEVPHLSQGFCG